MGRTAELSRIARQSNSRRLSADPRWWLIAAVSLLVSYVAASHSLLFFGGQWQVPLFLGCVAGLLAPGALDAVVAVGVFTPVAMLVSPPVLPYAQPTTPVMVLVGALLAVLAAGTVGWLRSTLAGDARARATLAFSALLVVWVLVNLWLPLLAQGGLGSGYGALGASNITPIPQPGHYRNDDAIYRRTFYLMHEGVPYYRAYYQAWTGLEQHSPLPSSVVGIRLPTFFWLWRLLPADAFSIVYLYLALASVGVVGAALIGGQLLGARYAVLSAIAVASYALGVGFTVYVTYVDIPAAAVALAGVALFLRARITQDRRWLWAAAALLCAVALTREILLFLVILAAFSALLEAKGERLSAAIPWLAAIVVFAIGYAAHAVAASPYVGGAASSITYMNGGPSFVVDGLTRFSVGFTGLGLSLALLAFAGALGAAATYRRAGIPFAAFAVCAVVLPWIAMLRIGNPGIDDAGRMVNYWGMLVLPLALALWPAFLLPIGWLRLE